MPPNKSPQDHFLAYSRIAFRRLHGLDISPPAALPLFPELLPLARKHRMVGLLYAGLPANTLASWQKKAFAQASQSARCTTEALNLLQQLEQAITQAPILIKGPGLALQAWPDPALRVYDDFDFRCRREDFPIFQDIVLAAGYQPYIPKPDHCQHLWHFGWGVTFRHPDGLFLEVNHRLFPRHFPCPPVLGPTGDCLPVSAQTIDGESITLPTPAAHLVLSSAHALWHGGERLAWIADIAGLLVRHPGILQQAREICGNHTFLQRALTAACLLADQIFGPDIIRIPDPTGLAPVVKKVEKEGATSRKHVCGHRLKAGGQPSKITLQTLHTACSTYRRQLTAPTPPSYTERRRLQRPLCSRWESLRACSWRALTPGEPDFSSLHLKPEQQNRYWLYRPLRILRNSIRKIRPPGATG